MSNLYKKYMSLKIEDSNYFYLFENGIFFIFISDDAKFMADKLNLKLTNLNSSIVKCGFPVSQLNKYLYIFDKENYKVKIVNSKSMLSYSQKDYLTNNKIKKLLKKLSTTNSSNLSISQTYDFIDSISSEAQNIIAEIEK